ncbi:hypothetical protein pb186bvf_003826 [Paramecium bursaria]
MHFQIYFLVDYDLIHSLYNFLFIIYFNFITKERFDKIYVKQNQFIDSSIIIVWMNKCLDNELIAV